MALPIQLLPLRLVLVLFYARNPFHYYALSVPAGPRQQTSDAALREGCMSLTYIPQYRIRSLTKDKTLLYLSRMPIRGRESYSM